METLVVRGLEIETLFASLREDYSSILQKIWGSGEFVNGVFIHSERVLRTMSEQSITIIVQHQKTRRECEVTVVCSGGGEGLLRIDFGSESGAESTFLNYLRNLAKVNGWRLDRKFPGLKGTTCPFCNAFYIYRENVVREDGSVVCQNCNRSFILAPKGGFDSHIEKVV